MRKQSLPSIAIIHVIATVALLLLVSGATTSLLTFDNDYSYNSKNNAFAQQANNSNFETLQNLTETNTNSTQQTQEPQLKPFTIPRNNQAEVVRTDASGISGSSNSDENKARDDIVLLSQRYNSDEFMDEIVGEVLNNGSETAEFVQITASFYDGSGAILGSEMAYADPSTVNPGDRAPFKILITSDTVKDDTETYEFTLQWRDTDGTDQSVRVTGEQAQDAESGRDNDNSDGDNSDGDNSDGDNSDGDNSDGGIMGEMTGGL